MAWLLIGAAEGGGDYVGSSSGHKLKDLSRNHVRQRRSGPEEKT